MSGEVRRLPIRHHGALSGRAVVEALDQWQPDAVLLEGPPEAAPLLEWVGTPELIPPVAMMIAVRDAPEQSVAYPMAAWSPEWQTMRWAAAHDVPLTFMDLPLAKRLALDDPESTPRSPAMGTLASLAGHAFADAWWDELLASATDPFDGFAAVEAALAEARAADAGDMRDADGVDLLREAAMRLAVRRVVATGAERVAVVCGAWHAPALADLSGVTADRARLRGLSRVRVDASWIPWTPQRLQRASGYGAGIDAPGWSEVLAEGLHDLPARWVTRWAHALRRHGVRAGAAQVVDAVRLAGELSVVRERRRITRQDLDDAVAAVFPEPAVEAVREWVLFGHAIGRVPEDAPAVPLVRSVRAEQRRLRLPTSPGRRDVTLDLRQERGRAKSQLLHQLRLLGVPWGRQEDASEGALGTFREQWTLSWTPSCERALVASSPWGVTAAEAAERRILDGVGRTSDVAMLVEQIQGALKAGLDRAPDVLLDAIDRATAEQPDWLQLLHAAPGLADVVTYGDVRGLSSRLRHVAQRLLLRGLSAVVEHAEHIDDEAASQLVAGLHAARRAVRALQDDRTGDVWARLVDALRTRPQVHARVRGLAARWQVEAGDEVDVRNIVTQALAASEPDSVAAWLEGWLDGSAHVLVHRAELWAPLDVWLADLSPTQFERVLPVLRRTFARLDKSVRRDVARVVAVGESPHRSARPYDVTRAEGVLATLEQWMGRG